MSYHGTGRASLENAVARAIRREHAKANGRKNFVPRPRDPDAYAVVVGERERLGLPAPQRMSREQTILRMHSNQSKRGGKTVPVTLAGQQPEQVIDARTAAEDRIIDAVTAAVKSLSFALEELTQIPNPNSTFSQPRLSTGADRHGAATGALRHPADHNGVHARDGPRARANARFARLH